jgi:hypothetical protein
MLATPHLSILRSRAMRKPGADLSSVEGVVSPRVLDAMRAASNELARLGVPHALVGGLAVGAHGYPRATKDVDFLVGDEAFERHEGGIVTMKPGVPIQIGGVLIDLLSAQPEEGALTGVPVVPAPGDVPVAPVEALVHLKLKSPRMKDASDVVELLKAGVDRGRCRAWLAVNAPALAPRFEELVERADRESE